MRGLYLFANRVKVLMTALASGWQRGDSTVCGQLTAPLYEAAVCR